VSRNRADQRDWPERKKGKTMLFFLEVSDLERRDGVVVGGILVGERGEPGQIVSRIIEAEGGTRYRDRDGRDYRLMRMRLEIGTHWSDQPHGRAGWYGWLYATTDSDQQLLDSLYPESNEAFRAEIEAANPELFS
jgi:hypothetical protein